MAKAPCSRRLLGVSRGTLVALMLASPVAVRAQGFAGVATVVHGSATFNVTGNVQTIAIPTSSPVTAINWAPTALPSGGSINFLPAGNTVNYVGAAAATVPYTVLNRIISAAYPTTPVALYGSVTSTANTRVWFYSPGGLLIGSTATFNVGGLVLTAADPVTDGNGNYITTTGGTDNFSVAATAGSTSAITIQPGASIKALNSGQSNYIVAIAPQISQGGTISVAGSVALVAAESATFAVDAQGLFNISVSAGTTVANNTFVNTGSVGGPNVAPTGGDQRVYMVAVPKNNAITMAISSGGSIGFAVADAANLDGDQIVLSAGSNIADTGAGNPVVAGAAGSGTASLTVGGGSHTSNTYAVSTSSATVTDPTLDIAFASGLTVIAPQATVNAQAGAITVGGGLTVDADDNLTGTGGTANLTIGSGSITVGGDALVSAVGSWGGGMQNPGNILTNGGTAQVSITGGQLTVGGSLTVNAGADATDANAALTATANPYFDSGAYAQAGSAAVTVSGAMASLSVTNGIAVRADAISSADQDREGGLATGGTALIEAQSGGAISVGANGAIAASANASEAIQPQQEGDSFGSEATGGTAQVIANAGTITVAGVQGITAFANATGGSSSSDNGSGGSARGGTALIATQGASGSIATNTDGLAVQSDFSSGVEATATGGGATGNDFSGGNATGGSATLQVTGAGQSIAFDHGNAVLIEAGATGGVGGDEGEGYAAGGNATGGSAQLSAGGGAIAITHAGLSIDASGMAGADNDGIGGNGTGGIVQLAASNGGSVTAALSTSLTAPATGGTSEAGAGGNATGGTVQLTASSGGTVTIAASPYMSASATGGSGSGTGGNALGGNILVTLGANAINFDPAGGTPELDTSYTPGSSEGGPLATGSSAGGVMLTDLGTLTLAGGLTIDGNTRLYAQAGGSIAVSGRITGVGAGAYLHLVADDLGTGTGTVILASNALDLPGNDIDIYYNPASLGTPTVFSPGIGAGNATAYQLVNTIDQLQLVGSYLSQNFALGRNIDASATQGWNAGAGFVPIGNVTTPFTGNFDGLDHAITNLYINQPNGSEIGLFGQVGAGAGSTIVIRNVGLVNAQVLGQFGTGGLIGVIGAPSGTLDNVTVSNSYTTGSVSGNTGVGGLVGDTTAASNVNLTNDHSDADIALVGFEPGDAGGLTGLVRVDANTAAISDVFATGSITGTTDHIANVGGLIGANDGGALTQAYATGAVSVGANAANIGGLIGANTGTVNQAYATGAAGVGTDSIRVGGFVGDNAGSISESWVSGPVSAPTGTDIGGFAGLNTASGTITNAYWDSYSTGQAAGFGTNAGTVTQLDAVTSDPGQPYAQNGAFNLNAYSNFTQGNWIYDNYTTRPVGAWETPVAQFGVATIDSAHQVQLIDLNLGGSYLVTQNIDMRGTGGTIDIWGPGGFMPLGLEEEDPPFTGTLAGAGHVLANLTIGTGGYFYDSGLVQENYGTIRDIGLANVNIAGGYAEYVGALAGVNAGQISDSFATGTITVNGEGGGIVGGLVGLNADGASYGSRGTITQSYASVAISAASYAGGLVGDNEGGISGSYANGPVSGVQTGGLVGESTDVSGPTVTNAYWDTQLSGQSLGCGSVGYAGACSGATGLTTAQTLQSASFTGFTIDTQGGQGLPWRQYAGDTTPLLEAFLTPISVQPGSLTMQYDALVPVVGVTTYGAQASLTFGTAAIGGLTQNAGVAYANYVGGLYSNQLGYDFVASANPGTVIVTPAPLTLTASPDSRVYNATTISNTGDAVKVAGLYGDDSVGNLTQSFASPNVLGTNGSTLVVNPGYVIYDNNGGNNYAVTLRTAQGTITPAALAITYTATPTTITYGAAPPPLSGTVSEQGLQGNDTLASVTSGTALFTTTATAQSNVGSYAITGSGLVGNSGNYSFSFSQAAGNATALTIDQASLTVDVIANTQSRSYGAANPLLTYTDSGLENGDMLTGSLATTATTTSNVGVYAITQGTLTAGSNYTLVYTGANLTITPASLTVTYSASPLTSIYGTAPGGMGGSVAGTGLVLGQNLASITTGTAQFATTAGVTSNVGSYAVTGSGLAANSGNYSFSFVQAAGNTTALTIVPRALTLTPNPLTRIYGGTNPTSDTVTAAPATATTGLVNGDSIGSVSVTSPATTGSGVGTYALDSSVAPFGSGLSSNYVITYAANPIGLSVTPAALTLTYTASPGSSTYGQNPGGLTGSTALIGLVNGDTVSGVTSGTALWTTPATAASNVGRYAIDGSGIGLATANYTLTSVQAEGNATALTINPAALAILYTATATSQTYGVANPALTGSETATGLVNGDTLGSVTSGSAAYSTSGAHASSVGSYAVTGSGLAGSSSNYTYTFSQAAANATALTIVPASATITYTANPLTAIYGNVPGDLTGSESATGLVLGDTLASVTTGTAQFTTTAGVTSNVGSYAVTGSGLAANSGNYSFSFVQAAGNTTALTIVPRALTLTPNPLTRIYGGTNPTSDTVTAAPATATTGLVNGDSIGSVSVTSPATTGSGVGTYALDSSVAPFSSGLSSNYVITYAANPIGLSVTPAALTLTYTANPGSSTYGQAPTGLTGSTALIGLVNGDTVSGVTSGTALWTTPATAASSVGSYAINGSGIGLATANYTLTAVQAEGNASALTVNPASATITYTANPLTSVYGNMPSGLTGSESASGLVDGDTLATATSGTALFTTTAGATSNVGSYAVTGSGLAASSGNYSFSFVQAAGNTAALTITPRPITVTADPQQVQVGAAAPVLTYAVTGTTPAINPGLVNGDQLSGQLASTGTANSPAGTYAIIQGTLAASANYQLTYVGALLTVVNVAGPIVALGDIIEVNLPDQPDNGTPGARRTQAEQEAALTSLSGAGLYPPAIAQSLINDRLVTTTAPVNEPVTSNGNPSLWSPGAP